ncbi:MAG: response regulator [Anaerolineae bacterium]|nr:response regulator [Anaerolineae bacterium]
MISATWLIAEDDADIRNLVAILFKAWGYDLMVFDTGGRVWDWLDSVEAGSYAGPLPEFALMDIRMPGKKGNEVAERMRTVAPIRNIPIVLMTAFALNADQKDNMLKDGVDEIIHKPLPDFDRLRQILQDVIKSKLN